MKKSLKKILIVLTAVVFAMSIHVSVAAESGNKFPLDRESIFELIQSILTPSTTQAPDNTTAANSPTTGTGEVTTKSPINHEGTGRVTTETPTTVLAEPPVNNNPTNNANDLTTEPTGEVTSYSPDQNLSDLLMEDSAAVLIQTTVAPFTLTTPLIVGDDDGSDFTWQKAAIIAAAVLFVVLVALVAALLIQRNNRIKEEEEERRQYIASRSSGTGNVPVEVMSPERIAELLGSSISDARHDTSYTSAVTEADAYAAIKAATLIEQLSHSYSDPLIRKYTDAPVVISSSAISALDGDDISGEDILKATDSMLDDITGEEMYASDVSGLTIDNEDDVLNKTFEEPGVCSECGRQLTAGEVFCHGCGAYIG